MTSNDGLICAFVLDGEGGGRELDWAGINSWKPDQGVLWVHLDRTGDAAERWLREDSGLKPLMVDTLLQEDVRPRVLRQGDALLVVLRGVNLNPGADPEDMVGVRVWLGRDRIFTIRHRRIMAVNELREAVQGGTGPRAPGEFLASLAKRLIERMGPVIDGLEEAVDDFEDEIVSAPVARLRKELGNVRRQAIQLRRYLAPQREVISHLQHETVDFLTDTNRAQFRETGDRTIRYLEDLESARERAALVQEEVINRLSDQMNKAMYLLSVVAAILLPPSLLTGLFGINVGGMPGVESPLGFALVVIGITVIAVVEYMILRRMKWI